MKCRSPVLFPFKVWFNMPCAHLPQMSPTSKHFRIVQDPNALMAHVKNEAVYMTQRVVLQLSSKIAVSSLVQNMVIMN